MRESGRTEMKLRVALRNFGLIIGTSFPNQAKCSLSSWAQARLSSCSYSVERERERERERETRDNVFNKVPDVTA
jgi:hypothetical protein